jgi:flagellar motor switch protein FliN/FliY
MAKASATATKAKNGSHEAESQSPEAQSQNQALQQDTAVPAGADSKKQVQSVEFSEAAGPQTASSPVSSVEDRNGGKLDIILDMNVPVSVSIGQTEISVRRLLQLGPGSVLKLDKPIDAPVDLFLKNVKFATGDVVVVDSQFAVRIKQIIGVGNTEDRKQMTADRA